MSYTHLDYVSLQDPLKSVFHHADMYLFDTYGMFRTLPPAGGDGGSGLFSIALVLACVVDGLAAEVWPGGDNQEQRFKKLIRCKLPWGAEGKGKWLDKGNAADQLYKEFRNPLVHELGKDEAGKRARSRPQGYVEPIIGRWGAVPTDFQDIAKIDELPKWNNEWPILTESEDQEGKPRFKLAAAALYWAVKHLSKELLVEARTA